MKVRQANLYDVQAITRLYQSHIETWLDFNQQPAAYEDLSLYERWLHGGAWYSIETCAVWTAHLLQENEAIPLVVESDGEVVGHTEIFMGKEPDPYGGHMNISTLCVLKGAEGQGFEEAFLSYVEEMAKAAGSKSITVANPASSDFYEHLGFTPKIERFSIAMPAMEGRVFYKALELTNSSASQIKGWHMPLGRYQNAREEWERMRWFIWNGLPALVESNWHGLTVELTGQPAILHLHQHRENLGQVTARLWTKNPPTGNIITAIRDKAARLGYESIITMVDAPTRALIKDAEEIAPIRWLYAKNI